jgi:hypothetical protein
VDDLIVINSYLLLTKKAAHLVAQADSLFAIHHPPFTNLLKLLQPFVEAHLFGTVRSLRQNPQRIHR